MLRSLHDESSTSVLFEKGTRNRILRIHHAVLESHLDDDGQRFTETDPQLQSRDADGEENHLVIESDSLLAQLLLHAAIDELHGDGQNQRHAHRFSIERVHREFQMEVAHQRTHQLHISDTADSKSSVGRHTGHRSPRALLRSGEGKRVAQDQSEERRHAELLRLHKGEGTLEEVRSERLGEREQLVVAILQLEELVGRRVGREAAREEMVRPYV